MNPVPYSLNSVKAQTARVWSLHSRWGVTVRVFASSDLQQVARVVGGWERELPANGGVIIEWQHGEPVLTIAGGRRGYE